jgi:hypothetical protein
VLLDGEKHYAPDMPVSVEEVPMAGLSSFLNLKFGEGEVKGTLPATLTHYVSELERARCVDEPGLDHLRTLTVQAQDCERRGDSEGLKRVRLAVGRWTASLKIIRR